ncbi:hypothetical protein HYS72_03285 [Candidatus Pacearchaeota archaeon]|nr:hypothetical protein [Candidatus Pacearchaeota archaeon]
MTKNLEKKFPKVLSFQELINLKAKPVKEMIYFKLEINGEVGVYEPLNKDENGKIINYAFRNFLPKGERAYQLDVNQGKEKINEIANPDEGLSKAKTIEGLHIIK